MNKKQTQGTIIHFYYDILKVTMSRDGRKLQGSFLEEKRTRIPVLTAC